ncbi:MAG TPA: TIGR02530 family flagellar biosynthesis protein [Candidatus Acidoferrum sp.]|nr:TIGR02530 family flagellar biosynthesis protein [Candidatus Acidoferrum sp.]
MQIDQILAGALTLDAAVRKVQSSPQDTSVAAGERKSFDEVFRDAQVRREEPDFSKHAQARMSERGIALTDSDMLRLQDAIGKAGQKGVQKTLVLMDQRAFIVSVADNTVVTAMGGRDITENVFTQIDGAVII